MSGNMVTRKQDWNDVLLVKAGREIEIKPCVKKVLTKFHDVLKKKWIPECDFWFPEWHEKWHNLIFSSQVRSWVLLHDRRVWVFG